MAVLLSAENQCNFSWMYFNDSTNYSFMMKSLTISIFHALENGKDFRCFDTFGKRRGKEGSG